MAASVTCHDNDTTKVCRALIQTRHYLGQSSAQELETTAFKPDSLQCEVVSDDKTEMPEST